MYRYLSKCLILGVVCTLSLSGTAIAASPNLEWAPWFQNQIYQHPEIIAAREKMNAAFSAAEGRQNPLYNPKLETEIEREGDNDNYSVGISQTIDWWDKRGTRKQQAGFSRTAARQAYELVVQQKIAESLQTLIEWQAANQQSELALQQETQMETLITLITKRQSVGDLGQVDAELALLSFSQKLNETAHAQVRLRQSEAQLRELLSDWSPKRSESISVAFWSFNIPRSASHWVDEHSAVTAAKAEWEVIQQSAKLVQLESKAEPTFGINAGKTGDDNVVALTFSMPLNIRNNFSAEVRAANQEALSAEAQYRAIRRKQQFAIESSRATLSEFQQRFERLKSLMRGRGERIESLLEKQWSSGDMSTTEYLLALQQRAEGLVAGIELQTQFQLARIEWLLQSGQLTTVLKQL